MKIVTCLGTGSYQSTTYVWKGKEWETALFPEALAAWLRPAEILVLLTPEAKQSQNWSNLHARLEGGLAVRPIDIPPGKTVDELWGIFQALADCLLEGDLTEASTFSRSRNLPGPRRLPP